MPAQTKLLPGKKGLDSVSRLCGCGRPGTTPVDFPQGGTERGCGVAGLPKALLLRTLEKEEGERWRGGGGDAKGVLVQEQSLRKTKRMEAITLTCSP